MENETVLAMILPPGYFVLFFLPTTCGQDLREGPTSQDLASFSNCPNPFRQPVASREPGRDTERSSAWSGRRSECRRGAAGDFGIENCAEAALPYRPGWPESKPSGECRLRTKNSARIGPGWPLRPPRPRGRCAANLRTLPGLSRSPILGQIFGLAGVHRTNVGLSA
jgi:hypothetical protein